MKILFVSPEVEDQARGIAVIMRGLVEAARAEGHEVGLVVGYPADGTMPESNKLTSKLDLLNAQHYLLEGRRSFRYLGKGELRPRTVLLALANLTAFKNKQIKVDHDHITRKGTVLDSLDFLIQSPFYYQLLVYSDARIPRFIMRRLVKKYDIDMVIAPAPSVLTAKSIGAKLVHFVHDAMPLEVVEAPPTKNTPMRYARQFYSTCFGSDLILTNSKDTASKVHEMNPDANVHIAYGIASGNGNGSENSAILAKHGLKKGKFLLFASTIEKRKNVIGLLDAYSLAQDEIDMPLVIVGTKGFGYKEIQAHYERLDPKTRKNIHFLGYVSESDKYALFNNAFALVFPSVYEGIGLMVIEAMQAGLPVITSRRGALPEAGGDAAYYIEDPYNPREIADAILKLKNDPGLVKNMIKKGHEQQEKFTPAKFQRRVARALSTLE